MPFDNEILVDESHFGQLKRLIDSEHLLDRKTQRNGANLVREIFQTASFFKPWERAQAGSRFPPSG